MSATLEGEKTLAGISPAKAWLRALELTAPIPQNPHRVLPTVIEEMAARMGDAPALLSERESFSYALAVGKDKPASSIGMRSSFRGSLLVDAFFALPLKLI